MRLQPLLEILRRHTRLTVACLTVAAFTGVSGPLGIYAMQFLVDAVVRGEGAAFPIILFVLASATGVIASEVQGYYLSMLTRKVRAENLLDLSQSVLSPVDIGHVEDPDMLDQIALARAAGTASSAALLMNVLSATSLIFSLAGYVALLTSVGPQYVILLLLPLAPGLWIASNLAVHRVKSREVVSRWERLIMRGGLTLTDAKAAQELRFGQAGEKFLSSMSMSIEAGRREEDRFSRWELWRRSSYAVLCSCALVLVSATLLYDVRQGAVGAAEVVAVLGAAVGVVGLLGAVVDVHSGLRFETALYGRFVALRDSLWSSGVTRHGNWAGAAGGLRVEDLAFGYPTGARDILCGVSLVVPRGRVVALMGENGSGKSTFMKVLLWLYRPGRGSVVWDGHEVSSESARAFRGQCAIVQQDVFRFDGTVRDNLTLWRTVDEHTDRDLWNALRIVGLEAAVAALHKGLDTPLTRDRIDASEGGVNLSGGQWQRLALARVLLASRVGFVVMDEPSTFLDTQGVEMLGRLLESLKGAGAAVLLMTHDERVLRHCEARYRLVEGKIVTADAGSVKGEAS